MVNAMNTSDVLSDILHQWDIPRLLNQEIKEHKSLKKSVEHAPFEGTAVLFQGVQRTIFV